MVLVVFVGWFVVVQMALAVIGVKRKTVFVVDLLVVIDSTAMMLTMTDAVKMVTVDDTM